MANLQGSAYEPRVDNIRGFEAVEEEVEAEEGSRLPLLIVIALLVLAAFGGVVWLAYTQGVERGRADAPRIIMAQSGPVKEAPANGGGEQTPYTGLKIYQQPVPPDEDMGDSSAAPPASMPTIESPDAPPALRAAANGLKETSSKAPNVQTAAPANKIVSSTTSTSAPASHAPAALERQATVAQASVPARQSGPDTASAVSGIYVLQIGAYKSQSEANDSWRAFEGRHPIVGGYPFDIKQVDLGGKGVWYRLRIGSFADKDAATALCAKLRADGGSCFLAK